MTDILVPTEQEGTKAVVKTWLKKVGDAVKVDDPIVELETDKVAVEVAATSAGVLSEILVADGAEVEPGTILGRITSGGAVEAAAMAMAQGVPAPKAAAPRAASTSGQLPPGIRKMLADNGLDARDVPFSGARLTREDIQAELDRRSKAPAAGITRVPHDSMRRRIAEHLSHSVAVAPHVTAMFEADFSAITAHRAGHKDTFAKDGANLTFTAYFVAACVAAMKAAPAVNGRWYDDRIDIYDDINIGIGTALGEKGLIVPVIHRAQTLSLLQIAQRLTEMTEKARTGKLSQDDVRGGTFSISNHGVSGSLLAAPIIINQPQSAILGVGKLEKRAVVRDDAIVIRPMAYVTLTIDHRVIDAFQTNAWLSKFVDTLENWPSGA
ncbi:MAG TPA: 2-oxo acid dehydrogenase subunit E2 [Rhizomicrobium sp.]|jgi:2-oxoglutarate dehydrogenase E2 component (dihydrolipoamide succinyltransferase)